MTKTPSNLQDPKSGGIRQGEDGRGRSGCGVGLGLETRIESASDGRRHISLAVKRAGEPSAGNRHARFDVAGAGNQLTARIVRHSQRKRRVTARPSLRSKRRQSPTLQAEPTERRASPRPYSGLAYSFRAFLCTIRLTANSRSSTLDVTSRTQRSGDGLRELCSSIGS
jgi:hypothetical protein